VCALDAKKPSKALRRSFALDIAGRLPDIDLSLVIPNWAIPLYLSGVWVLVVDHV